MPTYIPITGNWATGTTGSVSVKASAPLWGFRYRSIPLVNSQVSITLPATDDLLPGDESAFTYSFVINTSAGHSEFTTILPKSLASGVNLFSLPLGGVGAQNEQPLSTTTKTSSYTANLHDSIILADPTSAALTVTLPTATLGQAITVKNVSSGANAVTVVPASGTIDGGSLVTINSYTSNSFISDGTNWWLI